MAKHYTRGFEVFFHYLQLLKVSLLRNLAVATLLGLVCSALFFSASVSPEGKKLIPKLIQSELRGFIGKSSTAVVIEGKRLSVGQRELLKRFSKRTGRSLSFAVKQSFAQGGLVALFGFFFLALWMQAFGERLSRHQRKRGGILEDTTKPQNAVPEVRELDVFLQVNSQKIWYLCSHTN